MRILLGLLDELDAPEDKSRPIIVNCDLANAIEPRLTQHLPAIVPIEIARIFLRRTFGYTVSNQGFSELALQPLAGGEWQSRLRMNFAGIPMRRESPGC